MRAVSLALMIPAVMLATPLVGFAAGWWLDQKFGTTPWCKTTGALLGMIAGGRETYRLILKINQDLD
jgi:F0F1-type ATP synthase assembly protein I